MPRRRLEAEVLQYIIVLLSPPFPKREEPRAQSLKRRGKRILRSLHEDGGMPEQISFYGGISILWGETEKWFCLKGKKASRINLERKVGSRGDQSSGKLLQQHSRELRISLRGQRSWKNHNCQDDNLREGGQCYARVGPTP